MASIQELDVELIRPSPFQPRQYFADAALEEMAANIRAVGGIKQPVVVRPIDDEKGWELVCGERRLRAARLAGLQTVPAIVDVMDDATAASVVATENIQREDLRPLEEGRAVKVLEQVGYGREEIAAKLGKTEQWVARRLSLASLSEAWRGACTDPRNPFWQFGVAQLELLARLPAERQDEIKAEIENGYEFKSENCVPSVSVLRAVSEDGLANLAAAPWEMEDATLVPEAGACSECPKRTSVTPLLFDLTVEGRARGRKGRPADHCLDHRCWGAKLQAHIRQVAAETSAKSERPCCFVSSGYAQPEERRLWKSLVVRQDVEDAKRSDPNAQPGVLVNGPSAGQIIWFKERKAEKAGQAKLSPAQKRAKVVVRRAAHLVKAVADALSGIEEIPRGLEVLPATIAFCIEGELGEDLRDAWKRLRRGGRSPTTELMQRCWAALRARWAARLLNHLQYKPLDNAAEAREVADLIGLDIQIFERETAAAIPLPGEKPRAAGKPGASTNGETHKRSAARKKSKAGSTHDQ